MDDPGFNYSVLSEFRDRMADGDHADRLLAVMVARLVDAGVVRQRGRVRTDSTHVQHVLTAASTNIIRLSQRPDRQHRPSTPFYRLCKRLTS